MSPMQTNRGPKRKGAPSKSTFANRPTLLLSCLLIYALIRHFTANANLAKNKYNDSRATTSIAELVATIDRQAGLQCLSMNATTTQCFHPQTVPYMSKSLPLLLGLGSPRGGSAIVFSQLDLASQIIVGDSKLVGQQCCGSELHYFNRRFSPSSSLLDYSKRYFRPGKPRSSWAAERTLDYTNHPLVPHRIHALLGNNVFFVWNFRDPVESFVSNFFRVFKQQRHDLTSATAGNATAKDFVTWGQKALKAYNELQQCQDQVVEEFYKGYDIPASVEIDGLVVPFWAGTELLDSKVYDACHRHFDAVGADEADHAVLQVTYAAALARYRRVFSQDVTPTPSFVCIFHSQLKVVPGQVLGRLAKALGLTEAAYFETLQPADSLRTKRTKLEVLEDLMQITDGQIRSDAAQVLTDLAMVTQGEFAFAERFCRKYGIGSV